MIYVASPYTHPVFDVMEQRYEVACEFTAKLLNDELWCYSPIVHCHEIAKKFNLPRDFGFWKKYNLEMIRKSDELYVLGIEGWKESKGVTAEIEFAQRRHKPIMLWTNHNPGWFGEPL